jgi:single-strand DNA-binding protein
MVSLNKIMVIGNLGGDPEMRYTPNGNPVTSFSLATNRRYTSSDGERHEETEWFRIITWSGLAERCNQYLTKGQRAYVEGRFTSRTYKGSDGQERTSNEINANNVLFLSQPVGTDSNAGESLSARIEIDDGGSSSVDDLPF